MGARPAKRNLAEIQVAILFPAATKIAIIKVYTAIFMLTDVRINAPTSYGGCARYAFSSFTPLFIGAILFFVF